MNTLIALPNISQIKRPVYPESKSADPKTEPIVQPNAAPATSAPVLKGVPPDLAKVHFAGINLAEAIKSSSHVAKAQQLQSLMSMQDYMDTVQDHPHLLRNTAQYAQDMINLEGVRKKSKYGRTILEYDFFSHPKNPKLYGLKGNQGSINDVMLHIRAAAKRQDLGKKPIVLMGDPGSGKTSIGDLIVDGYERYSIVIPTINDSA